MMKRSFFFKKILGISGMFLALVFWGVVGSAQAELFGHGATDAPTYDQYVAPMALDGISAGLYPSPRPVPPRIGYTYITYQPLAPHEFLYKHHRRYKTLHDDAPPTRTSVHWR